MVDKPVNLVAIEDILVTLVVGTIGGPIIGLFTRKPVSGVVIVSIVWAVLGVVAQAPLFGNPLGSGILGALLGAIVGTALSFLFVALKSIAGFLDMDLDQEKED